MAITHEFTRVWWETGEAGAGRAASLWRPMAPPGHASLGDVLVTGVEPPPHGAPTVSVRGRAVQVDPMKPMLKPPGIKHLKLNCDILLSTFAFKFNLRRCTAVARRSDPWPSTSCAPRCPAEAGGFVRTSTRR